MLGGAGWGGRSEPQRLCQTRSSLCRHSTRHAVHTARLGALTVVRRTIQDRSNQRDSHCQHHLYRQQMGRGTESGKEGGRALRRCGCAKCAGRHRFPIRGQTKINKGASGNHRVASLLAHCQRSFGARRRCRLAGKGKRGMRRGSTRTSHGGRYKKKGSLCSNFFLVRVLYLMSIIQSILVAAAVGQAHDMCRIHTDSANWTAYPWRNASVIVKPGYHSAPSPFSFQYRKTYLCYLAKHGMTLWLNSTRPSSANPPRYSPTAAVDDFPSTWGPLCIPLIPTCSA